MILGLPGGTSDPIWRLRGFLEDLVERECSRSRQKLELALEGGGAEGQAGVKVERRVRSRVLVSMGGGDGDDAGRGGRCWQAGH